MSALETDIAIMMGNMEFAERWAAKQCVASSSKPDLCGIHVYVTFVKLLMRQNKLMEAESLLEQIAALTEKAHQTAALLMVLILQAIVFRETGREEEAKKRMEQAILLAREAGCKRPFLDQWHKIGSLLSSVQDISPLFVRELVKDHRAEAVSSAATMQAESNEIESLSPRERDVLECIAQGFSNTEIAEKLYISIGTVKWHVNNIFGKLDVKSRTQAVIRAQELGIL
jgi:LuxR family maltose regulon positive regulatory protein